MNRRTVPWSLACVLAASMLLGACDRAPAPTGDPAAETASGAAADPLAQAEQRFVDHLYAAHILPASRAFAARGDALLVAARAFCDSRDAGRFEALQQAWRETTRAWQPMRWLQTGPGSEQHRMLRIDAWPQARLELVATRVNQLLASDQAVDAEAIANQPVQVQGLPALETLLFEDRGPADFGADAAGDRRCALVVGIAGNIATIARLQHELWQQGAEGGSRANAVFVSAGGATVPPHNVINQVGNLLMQQLVELKDAALGAPLGFSPGGQAFSPRPRLAHSWRSRASLERILASLESVAAVYSGGADGFGLDDLLALRDAEAAAAEFETLLGAALEQARALRDDGLTIHEGVGDEATHARLVELYERVRSLEVQAQLVMMPALDVALTFNFADGD